MANGSDMFGVINTHPAGNTPNKPIDNVIAKGLTINSVTLINEPELTDHCGLAVELEFNN
jgi:endonuclease/exonuclease/phosphatase family metal-dependent hydrolase